MRTVDSPGPKTYREMPTAQFDFDSPSVRGVPCSSRMVRMEYAPQSVAAHDESVYEYVNRPKKLFAKLLDSVVNYNWILCTFCN